MIIKKQTKLTETDLAALSRLQKQVKSAIKDGFRNELDTRRWLQWLKLKPLTEDQLVPGTGKQIGAGDRGALFKYNLDPELGRSPVVLKYDTNVLNDNATSAGLPVLNPQQSVRAVAAYKISQHLQLGIIPQTEFFVGTDDNGRPKLGQAMEVVIGAIGQTTVVVKKEVGPGALQEIQRKEDIVKNPDKYSSEEFTGAQSFFRRYEKVNGKWYSLEPQIFPVNIDYNDPVVQKGLSDLQVFDYIIGHADRNAGNWIYQKQGDIITGVKGIDNDDTFGAKWLPENPDAKYVSQMGSKTPGIPPFVDISTALSILKADFNKAIRPLLAGLSDEEINKAAERFKQVQQEVVQRAKDGQIASMGDVGDQAKLELGTLTNMQAQPGIRQWGDDQVTGAHNKRNSYLGVQIAEKNRLAQQYQVGVAPESGVVLVERKA